MKVPYLNLGWRSAGARMVVTHEGGQAFVELLDANNFQLLSQDQIHDYYGGTISGLEWAFEIPHDDNWYIAGVGDGQLRVDDILPRVGPPPGGPGQPMSDTQIRDPLDDMLGGQDLNPAEKQRLSEILNNELRQASAQGLSADDAYARAENAAVSYMASELHRSYVRKATRLGTFADARRTTSGDFLSRASGAVIPAARDAKGDLIWVDKVTGARVAEGAPNSMTIPERGYYHLGHEFGYENWRVLRQAMEEGWTQQELNDFMNQHGNYRLETPSENLSHAHEDRSPYVPNAEWTPHRILEGAAAGGGAGTGTAPFINAPPNLPNVLDHPPVGVPPVSGNQPPTPAIPPLQPTPALPPWLLDPSAGHTPETNPLLGPYGVNIDAAPAPVAPPSTGLPLPHLPDVNLPDISVSPEAAENAGKAGTVGAAGLLVWLTMIFVQN
ncbi:MAG TPA: GH-E family nuclease [Mycobacterium sp.]|nr:GH-E family nuclease [Mycobacterium sp.]